MLCNPTRNLDNSLLADTGLSLAAISVFTIGCLFTYQDLTHTLHVMSLIATIKHKRDKYPLNAYHLRQLTKRVNIFAKYMIHAITITTFTICTIVIIIETIYFYMDVDANVIMVFINFLIGEIALYQGIGMI